MKHPLPDLVIEKICLYTLRITFKTNVLEAFYSNIDEVPRHLKVFVATYNDVSWIQYVSDPSPELQCMVVSHQSTYIKYIQNPHASAQEVAISMCLKDPRRACEVLDMIQDQCEAVQLMVVRTGYTYAIRHCRRPTEQVYIVAVQKNPVALAFIRDPPESVQRAAITVNPWAIAYIRRPTEAIKRMAVQWCPEVVQYTQ